MSVHEAFSDNLVHTEIDGVEEALVTIDDFRAVLLYIGFGELTKKEEIIFNARMGSYENVLIVSYLVEDLKSLGIDGEHSEDEEEEGDQIQPDEKSISILSKLLAYS